MSARKVLPPERALVPRGLYFTALSRAIEWQRGALAAHDPLYGRGPSCCAPGSRCDAYQRAAADLARFEEAKEALYAGGRPARRAKPETPPAPEARREDMPAAPSVFRCAECGNGTRLRAWAHVNIHGDLGPTGISNGPTTRTTRSGPSWPRTPEATARRRLPASTGWPPLVWPTGSRPAAPRRDPPLAW